MKNEGDLVVEEEPLVEVETDKLTTSLPAASSGFLHKIFYKSQEVCPVII
jgi:pyruvate/2-oxoglutarate dehydrogenase complex dihydrolipoamide acyltransferase (E2) component